MSDRKWNFLATLISVLLPLLFYRFLNHHSPPPETPIVLPAVVKPPALYPCRRCPHTHPTLPSPTNIDAPTLPGRPTLPPLTIGSQPVVVPTLPPPTIGSPPVVVPLPTINPLPPTLPTPTPPILLNPPPSLPTLPPPSPPSPGTPSTPPPPAPPPPGQEMTCSIDTLKLNGCVDWVVGQVHAGNGGSAKEKCCPVLQGNNAAVCLCNTIKAKLLSITIFLPIALEILVQCGNTPPPGFTCH